MQPRILIAVAVGVCGVWLIKAAFPATEPASKAPAAIPVVSGEATRRDVPDYINAIGTVQSIDAVAVESRVSGQILQVYFHPGQDVVKGQPLFLIDPRPYQAALDQAEAQLAHDQALLAEAQADLTRYRELAPANAIPKQQAQDQAYVVKQDQGTVELDKASVETAKLNLAYCHIEAPISGRTGALLVDLGNNVQATTATSLVSITQLRPIYVSFTIPQKMIDQIRRYQALSPLAVYANSQSGTSVGEGKLSLIDNQVSSSTGTVMMQATFPNDGQKLWPGEFVTVRLKVFTRRDVITVPDQTIMQGPNGSYVYVIKPDDTVARHGVDVVARQDGLAVVDKGLSDGQRVVTDGQYRLSDGVKVTIKPPINPS